ncbi:MAG TPA: hypothetical protein VME20_04755 [Acidimicrobiales bacterium]|nr:hypothetical protein [Acidimicrobiales bacterium]
MRALSISALREVAKRPGLWGIALVQLRAFVPMRWWARWPPLPLPAKEYMEFRAEAMYGRRDAKMNGDDLVGYLEWCRRMRALVR